MLTLGVWTIALILLIVHRVEILSWTKASLRFVRTLFGVLRITGAVLAVFVFLGWSGYWAFYSPWKGAWDAAHQSFPESGGKVFAGIICAVGLILAFYYKNQERGANASKP